MKTLYIFLFVFISSIVNSQTSNIGELRRIIANHDDVLMAHKGTRDTKVEKEIIGHFSNLFNFIEHLLFDDVDKWSYVKTKQYGSKYVLVYETNTDNDFRITIEIRYMNIDRGKTLTWRYLYSNTVNIPYKDGKDWREKLIKKIVNEFPIQRENILKQKIRDLENSVKQLIKTNKFLLEETRKRPYRKEFEQLKNENKNLKKLVQETLEKLEKKAKKVSEKVDKALKTAHTTSDIANNALSKSDTALNKASVANNTASNALNKANTASSVASNALRMASSGRKPDFEYPSDPKKWITASPNQEGKIVHGLGTNRFSNFQIIFRENEIGNNEVIVQGMNTFWAHPGHHCGTTFYIDKSDNPLNKVKWITADRYIFSHVYDGGKFKLRWNKNKRDNTNHMLTTAQFRIRIWK